MAAGDIVGLAVIGAIVVAIVLARARATSRIAAAVASAHAAGFASGEASVHARIGATVVVNQEQHGHGSDSRSVRLIDAAHYADRDDDDDDVEHEHIAPGERRAVAGGGDVRERWRVLDGLPVGRVGGDARAAGSAPLREPREF